MNFRVENVIVLFGLFALAIPVVLHFLQRRRFDELDWGAMQFLPQTNVTQRRRWLDEILLLLLRMAMIALIVLALATPISTSPWLSGLSDHSGRDVVFVLDGSYSMDVRLPGQPTPWKTALDRMQAHIADSPGARFSVLIARQPPVFAQAEFTGELDAAIAMQPRGNPGMPQALQIAWKHLMTQGRGSTKEIVVFTDQQRHGWADPATLTAFDNLGTQWQIEIEQARTDGRTTPSLRVINVGVELPRPPVNYSLAPLTASRLVANVGQRVSFQSALQLDGFKKYQPPRGLKVAVDGKAVEALDVPGGVELIKGQIPLAFQQRFQREGPHVVSLTIEADDALTADNEQHIVVDVVKELDILLVDGDAELSPMSSTFFLQRALAAKHVLPVRALTPGEIAKSAVIVLADVPQLSKAQIDALERFVTSGGSLLFVAGERVAKEQAFYNDALHRDGRGLLPARLQGVGTSKDGTQPEPRSLEHPALRLFRGSSEAGIKDVRFPKWTRAVVGPQDRATVMASLTSGDPWLIEKVHQKGRVILCTVPMDRGWDSNLPIGWEFPVLAHELAYYLGGSRNDSVLRDGRPIRIDYPGLPQTLNIRTPEIETRSVAVKSWPWVHEDTGAVGVYRVEHALPKSWAFVTPPDPGESDLTRMSDDDWRRVRDCLPVTWHDAESDSTGDARDAYREELWWLLLAGVVLFLGVEVWMTRRLALARGH